MLFIRNSKLTKFRKPLFIKEGLGSLRTEAQTLPARKTKSSAGERKRYLVSVTFFLQKKKVTKEKLPLRGACRANSSHRLCRMLRTRELSPTASDVSGILLGIHLLLNHH